MRVSVVAVFLIASFAAPGLVHATTESVAATCPAYRVSLAKVREHLARGDRNRALAALYRARAALADCIRNEAGATALAAAQGAGRGEIAF